MDLAIGIQILGQCMACPIPDCNADGLYQWQHEGHTFRVYQKNRHIYWESSLGSPFGEDRKSRELLSQILQFNLKRMRFMEGILFLEPESHQLYVRSCLPLKLLSEKSLADAFTDFLLNLETLEERFFPHLI